MTEDISVHNSNNTVHNPSDSSVINRDLPSEVDVSVDDRASQAELHDGNISKIYDQPESIAVNSIYDKKSFRITGVTVQHNLIRSTASNAEGSTNESPNSIDMSSAINSQTEGSDLYKVTSLGSAPIIPTSAQYGIAVVSNPNSEFVDDENNKFIADNKLTNYRLRSEYLPNGLNGSCGANLSNKEFNTRNERFKVVKIESNEPFKRGRWVCMDFLDQSMDQAKKAATNLSDGTCKQKDATSCKESAPEGIVSNGLVNAENVSNSVETENIAPLSQNTTNQLPNESNNHVNGDVVPNTVSPNQTFSMPFVSPSKVLQQPQSQAQSLTHIIIPQVSQASPIVSGSYGHCQVLPHSEMQHSQTTQQPSVQTSSLLQQSYVSVPTSQAQAMISQQAMQHSPHPQSETMLNQSGAVQQQQQQQPILQQSYQQSVQQPNASTTNNTTDPPLLQQQQQQQQQSSQVTPSSLPPSSQHFPGNQSCQQQIPPQQTYPQPTAQTQSMSQPPVQHLLSQGSQSAVHQQPPPSNSQSQCNMQQPPIHLPSQTAVNQSSIQSSMQYAPQTQPVVSQPASHSQVVQSHPQQMILQAMANSAGGNVNGSNGCANDSQQLMHALQQQQQQQQQIQHQQSLQQNASQTSPLQQQSSQPHHQPIIQSVPQQPQQLHHQQQPQQQQQQQQQQPQQAPAQQQQPAQQLLQTQIPSNQNVSQMGIQHQGIGLQNASSGQNTPSANQQHSSSPQIMQPSLQTLSQQQTPSHTILPSHQPLPQQAAQSLPVAQPLQQPPIGVPPQNQAIASNGNQVQTQYQSMPNQMNDSNIPVSVPQPAHQQHDVLPNLPQNDVILSGQYPQTQNITSAHASHVPIQQPYSNATAQHVNASNINLVPISVSNQQTGPQFYNAQVIPCSLPSCTVNSQSQDMQPSCTHQLQNIPNMAQSSIILQNLGHQGQQHLYSVPSQVAYSQQSGGAVVSQAALSNVQTQTTPVLQTCTTSVVPVQHYSAPPRSVSSTLTCGTVPVTTTATTYLTNVGGMQPSSIVMPSPTPSYPFTQSTPHIYATGQNAPSGATDQVPFCCTSTHFQEQVAECVRNEESSIQRSNEEIDSAPNNGNSVAIDNKIEQAMDLVKSHLMFAVREEVEVLKEKIAELMDRINQLEIENSILKANASQETLAQLPLYQQSMPSAVSVSSSTRPSSIASNTNSNTSSNIATNNQPP